MTKWLLLPFSGVYGLLLSVRNLLFDNQLFESIRPNIYSISVGNLTVGGTGKTPMVEFLIKWYHAQKPLTHREMATVSRGYGRRTKGFRIATDQDSAGTIGDEPLQLYRKFKKWVRVCVGERRVNAIRQVQQQYPETKVVLLDDAFQHRAIRPHLNLLLMDYNRPFYQDYPFPAGRLRERRVGARRADAVVVTKCPTHLSVTEQNKINAQLRRYAHPQTPIFFAGLHYAQPLSFSDNQPVSELNDVVLVSGLANADPLEQYVKQTYSLKKHHRFADHYAYTREDLDRVLAELRPGVSLLTTEKDWVKLSDLLTSDERSTLALFYLPVEVQFLPDYERAFTTFLDDAITNYRLTTNVGKNKN